MPPEASDPSSFAASGESYYTADHRVGTVVGATSLTATQVSAGTMVGTIGIHYTVGVGFALVWLGIWAGWLASMLFVAPQLRDAGGFTVANFLASRFGTGEGHVRGLAAAFIAAIYLVYTTAQYLAGGIVLEAVFGLEQSLGVVLLAALALSYTVVGGMLFSVYSDVVQVAVLVGGLLLATTVGVAQVGGLAALSADATAVDPQLVSPTGAPALTVGLALSFGFGIAIAPFELSRVYAMRDPETVRRAIPLSIAIQSVVAVCIALLGLIARLEVPDIANPDLAVVQLSVELFGPAVGGLLLLAVLAGILSTIDSVLLVSSAAISQDLFRRALPAAGVLDTQPGDETVHTVDRLATIAAAVIPIGLTAVAGSLGGLIQLIVALYTSLLAGTLFVPVLAGLYWSAATKAGVLTGMCSGLGAVLLWQLGRQHGLLDGGVGVVDPVIPGLVASLCGVALVSVARPPE